jgi:hypothetical protein
MQKYNFIYIARRRQAATCRRTKKMNGSVYDNWCFFLLGMAIVALLTAILVFAKEDPWERAKWNLIYRIRSRADPLCQCGDELDRLITNEMKKEVLHV